MPPGRRPTIHEYMMSIALTVRSRANCQGNRVGAVLAREHHIVSTGYNGTPHGMTNCDQGGCERCSHREKFPSGTGYDICICVHAEQNTLLSAARFGIQVENSLLYTTMRPCFGCAKEMLQAGVNGVRYLHDWRHPNEALAAEYERLISQFPAGEARIEVPDPDSAWAVSSLRGGESSQAAR